ELRSPRAPAVGGALCSTALPPPPSPRGVLEKGSERPSAVDQAWCDWRRSRESGRVDRRPRPGSRCSSMLRPRPLACITILGAGVAATAVVACQLDTGGFGVTSTSAEPAASSTGSGAPEGSTSGSGSASGTGPTSGAPTTDPPSATSTGDTGDTGDDLPDPDTSTTDPDPPAGCGPIL